MPFGGPRSQTRVIVASPTAGFDPCPDGNDNGGLVGTHYRMVVPALVCALLATSMPAEAHASTFVVDRQDDVATATACSAAPNDCSLRGAILAANAAPGADIVQVPAGTYPVTIPVNSADPTRTGNFDILGSVEIVGAGAGLTTVDGGNIHQVFYVPGGSPPAAAVVVKFSGLTIRRGKGVVGAGIVGIGLVDLTIDSVVLTDNHASQGGGGVAHSAGGNWGSLTIRNSEFTSNTATSSGGAVLSTGQTVSISSSTFQSNTAPYGGAVNHGSVVGDICSTTITNSTFVDNSASTYGGAFTGSCSDLLSQSTLMGNSGRGPALLGYSLTIQNSLLANDTCNAIIGVVHIASAGGNVESPGATCPFTEPTDSSGVAAGNLALGTLGAHGGPTRTLPVLTGSVAIDHAVAQGCPATDQRGIGRPVHGRCDSGAYEFEGPFCDDADGDGYGAPGDPSCSHGAATDCNDSNALVNPGRLEIPGNGLDDDCNASTFDCVDADGDGYAVSGGVCGAVDCNDSATSVNPGAPEIVANGLDDDCNAATPDCIDADADGASASGGACGAIDCNDGDPAVSPSHPEILGNGVDDDCNPATSDCADGDGDGYSASGGACGTLDCNDGDAAVNPGHAEVPGNGVDDDCSGSTPDCVDADADGYSASGGTCGAVDCNDQDAQVNPGRSENPGNGIDDDCNPATSDCRDLDGDGYGNPASAACAQPTADCNDANPNVNPGRTEIPSNGIDDDCNAATPGGCSAP